MKRITPQSGFSLVEILVAIAIIVTSTTVVLAILTSSFRTSNKSTSLELVRQNGTNAINQITRVVSYADSFVRADSASTCPLPPGGNYQAIVVNSLESGRIIEKRIYCTSSDLRMNDNFGDVSLLSKQVVLENGSCSFTCSQDNSLSPVIGLKFSLSSSVGNLAERKARLDFSTSIKMRNL